jgi:hypothetical protein
MDPDPGGPKTCIRLRIRIPNTDCMFQGSKQKRKRSCLEEKRPDQVSDAAESSLRLANGSVEIVFPVFVLKYSKDLENTT